MVGGQTPMLWTLEHIPPSPFYPETLALQVGDILVQGETGAQILCDPDLLDHFEMSLTQVRQDRRFHRCSHREGL